MPRYRFNHRYLSQRDGVQWGPFDAGQEIDLREEDADWLDRDSPGCLSPVVDAPPAAEPEPESESEPERDAVPARDRMHRGGRRRAAG